MPWTGLARGSRKGLRPPSWKVPLDGWQTGLNPVVPARIGVRFLHLPLTSSLRAENSRLEMRDRSSQSKIASYPEVSKGD